MSSICPVTAPPVYYLISRDIYHIKIRETKDLEADGFNQTVATCAIMP
jgi:hypothetical protein